MYYYSLITSFDLSKQELGSITSIELSFHDLHLPHCTNMAYAFILYSEAWLWQELIESIVWAHEQTPLANLLWWNAKALAIGLNLWTIRPGIG